MPEPPSVPEDVDVGLGTVLSVSEEIRFRRVQDEAIVLRQDAGEILVLNETGGRILSLLDGCRDLAAVIDTLLAEVDAPRDELRRDVLDFARELLEAGIALPVEPGDEE